jgi:hypothetical protein
MSTTKNGPVGTNHQVSQVYGPREQHRLHRFIPTSKETFQDWFQVWNYTTDFNELMGLLHELQTNVYYWQRPWEGVVDFLLEVGDSLNLASSSSLPSYCRDSANVLDYRKKLAGKARTILSLNFFKEKKDWWWALEYPALCDKVIRYFLDENASFDWGRVKNCPHPNSIRRERIEDITTLNFVQQFVRLGWTFRHYHDYTDSLDDTISAYLVSQRPRFLEIIAYLNELSWFGPHLELDDTTLIKLEEIALRETLNLPQNSVKYGCNRRRPETIEEAVLGGSDAAVAVLLQRVARSERQRINELYERSRVENERAERAKEADEKAKQIKQLTVELDELKMKSS